MALAHRSFRDIPAQAMPAISLVHAVRFAGSEPTCVEGTVSCPGCSVGCRVSVMVEHNRVVRVAADAGDAPSHGRLCPRADVLAEDQGHAWNRLRHPMMRRHRRESLSRVSWDQALTFVADEIQRVQISRGRGAIGWIGNGALDTESSYLFNKLFKGFLGTNHTDGGAPAGMDAAAKAMSPALGSIGSTACFDDVRAADVILILNCDVAMSHPVLFEMVNERRAAAPNSRVIVLDPRRTATAQIADVHVPLAPGSEAKFLQLVAKRLLAIGRIDDRFIRRYAEGFTDYRVALESLDEGELLAACSVHPARVDEVVEFLQGEGRLLTIHDMDSSSSGTAGSLSAAANLHLQLGEIGREGAGFLALSAAANAMGALESGATPAGLPGGRGVADRRERERLEVRWGVPAGSIQSGEGMAGRRMLEKAAAGELAVLWITGGLQAVDCDGDLMVRALRGCELVIVQDSVSDGDVALHADVLLPSAAALEKTGTMTSAERLVVRSQRLLEPPGEAKPDWWIAARAARLMGFDGFEYADIDAVWDEYRRLTLGSPCDQSGMTCDRLAERPLHWPCADERHVGTARRFMSGRFPTATGKARFNACHS